MIIIVEGIDGAGKSTLVDNLLKKLPNSIRLCFPSKSYESIGDAFRKGRFGECNPEVQYLLLLADRIHQRDHILKLNESHDYVIIDRHSISGMVYSSIRGSKAMHHEELCDLTENAKVMTFFLCCDVNTALSRIESRGEGFEKEEKKEFLEKVAKEYEKYEGILIDANKNAESVLENVLSHLK